MSPNSTCSVHVDRNFILRKQAEIYNIHTIINPLLYPEGGGGGEGDGVVGVGGQDTIRGDI